MMCILQLQLFCIAYSSVIEEERQVEGLLLFPGHHIQAPFRDFNRPCPHIISIYQVVEQRELEKCFYFKIKAGVSRRLKEDVLQLAIAICTQPLPFCDRGPPGVLKPEGKDKCAQGTSL